MNIWEAIIELGKGKKLRNRNFVEGSYVFVENDTLKRFDPDTNEVETCGLSYRNLKISNDWEVYNKPNKLLSNNELKDLEGIIKSFKKEVKYIAKQTIPDDMEQLTIILKYEGYSVNLPPFETGSAYINLEIGKHYTLKQLELFNLVDSGEDD